MAQVLISGKNRLKNFSQLLIQIHWTDSRLLMTTYYQLSVLQGKNWLTPLIVILLAFLRSFHQLIQSIDLLTDIELAADFVTVADRLSKLNIYKTARSNGLPTWLLQQCVLYLSEPLTALYKTGSFPSSVEKSCRGYSISEEHAHLSNCLSI